MKKSDNKNKSSQRFIDKINSTYGKYKTKEKENEMEKTIEIEDLENTEIENNHCEDNYEKLLKEKEEIEEQLKRRAAEFENFKRRTDKEKQELLEYGNVRLMAKFVDLLDDISNAEIASNNIAELAPEVEAIKKGIDMIYQKAIKLFEDEGVKTIETNIGDDFDVDFHEALMRQPSELEENKIVMVLQRGYTYKDKILRYAKVATSSGNMEN